MNTAVVTGGGKGLGREIAIGLAGRGLAVLVTDIDEASAKETADIIGESAWSMKQDVRDPASHRIVAEAAAARGPVTVWVNNAGVLGLGLTWELDNAEIERHVAVNLLGVIWGSRAAIDSMGSQGGHLINIASISALTPAPGLAVYAATKAAVLSFSVSLQGDIRRGGLPIRISAVCPDAIDTDMVRNVASSSEAGLLFSAGELLTADQIATVVLRLVGSPKLAVTVPRIRGFLAHLIRPFPRLGLWVLELFRRKGDKVLSERNDS